jgi:hypothetical protein
MRYLPKICQIFTFSLAPFKTGTAPAMPIRSDAALRVEAETGTAEPGVAGMGQPPPRLLNGFPGLGWTIEKGKEVKT